MTQPADRSSDTLEDGLQLADALGGSSKMLRSQPEFDSTPDPRTSHEIRGESVTRGPALAEDELQLLAHVRSLWNRRLLLLVFALIGGGIGLTASVLATPMYEGHLILGVIQSKLYQEGDQQPASVLLGNFRSILTSQAIARTVVRDFNLQAPPHELTAAQFLVRAVTVETIPGTTLLDLRVRLADPELAANAANSMAERSVELSKGLTVEEAVQVRDSIAAQVQESRQNLDKIAQQLEEAKKEGQVELQESDIDTLLDQRADLRELAVEIAGERARLKKAEEELGKRERIQTLNRSIDADPALAEMSRNAGVKSVLGLTLQDQQANPTYAILDEEVALARARLTELEQRRAQLSKTQNLDESTLPLLSRLYESQNRISRFETDLEIARQVYVDVATRYEQARVQVASRSAQLLVVDEATPASRPVSRHLVRNLVLGAVAGLLVAILYVLISRAVAALGKPMGSAL
jgi:uncharacterized protein involved in exopolysaccharide biosynthesis